MLRNIIITLLAFVIFASGAYAATANPTDDIKHDMNAMTALWNKGDVKGFVDYYKNSDETTYVSASIYKGYKNILKRYLASYPTPENMGTLTTSNLDIHALSPTIATITGEWALTRKDTAPAHGIFTLVWEKTAAGWKIVLDHTS